MAEEEMYNEALGAIQKGEKKRARDLLTRLLKINTDKADYWIWMSATVDTPKERIYCLQEALKLDPSNFTARRGLVILGVMAPDERDLPPPGTKVHRNWQDALPESKKLPHERPPLLRMVLGGVLAVVSLLVIGLIIYTSRPRPPVQVISYHPPTVTTGPSPTFQPTFTQVVRSPTATFTGPTPLWMLLQATYTSTPLYVPTPRSALEASRAGMADFMRQDYAKAIPFMQQVASAEPDNVDALYYLAESYRLQGDTKNAIHYYAQAIALQPGFAPAYLGRAQAVLASTPSSNVMPDLQTAVANDPGMGEIYMEEAVVALARQDYQGALGLLDQAGKLLTGSPSVLLYQAEAYLGLGQPVDALTAAREANQLDLTLLEAYRVLGQALQANGLYADSIQPLQLYLVYRTGNTAAWILLGKAYSAQQDWTDALQAFNTAIQLDGKSIDAYLARGEMYLAQKDGKDASSDFNHALVLDYKSFPAKIDVGRADLLLGLAGDAYLQFNQSESLAVSDADKAALYYWRATAAQSIGQKDVATRDWQRLLALPTAVVPADWASAALQALATATPTVTATSTLTQTSTPATPLTPAPTGTPSPALTAIP